MSCFNVKFFIRDVCWSNFLNFYVLLIFISFGTSKKFLWSVSGRYLKHYGGGYHPFNSVSVRLLNLINRYINDQDLEAVFSSICMFMRNYDFIQ